PGTWVESCRYFKLPVIVVVQFLVGINLLVEDPVYGECHAGTLAICHTVKMDGPLFTAHPTSCHQVGSERHEPAIGVVVCRTGFTTHLSLQVIDPAQPATGSAVNYTLQHVEHLVGGGLAEDLLHAGDEGGYLVAVGVL